MDFARVQLSARIGLARRPDARASTEHRMYPGLLSRYAPSGSDHAWVGIESSLRVWDAGANGVHPACRHRKKRGRVNDLPGASRRNRLTAQEYL